MILAIAVLSEILAPFPFEVDRRGIEENQVQLAEKIAAAAKESFLESIFGAPRRKRSGSLLLILW